MSRSGQQWSEYSTANHKGSGNWRDSGRDASSAWKEDGAWWAGRPQYSRDGSWSKGGNRSVPLTTGLRVREKATWRAASITEIGQGGVWLRFDNGEEAEFNVRRFEHIDGSPISDAPPPMHVATYAAPSKGWKGGGKGASSRGDWDSWAWDGEWDSWGTEAWQYDRQRTKGKGKGKGKGKRRYWDWQDGGDPSATEARALEEVTRLLQKPGCGGRVWVPDWPGRYQAALGTLRGFLENHPDKFRVVPESGKRYIVEFVDPPPARSRIEGPPPGVPPPPPPVRPRPRPAETTEGGEEEGTGGATASAPEATEEETAAEAPPVDEEAGESANAAAPATEAAGSATAAATAESLGPDSAETPDLSTVQLQ